MSYCEILIKPISVGNSGVLPSSVNPRHQPPPTTQTPANVIWNVGLRQTPGPNRQIHTARQEEQSRAEYTQWNAFNWFLLSASREEATHECFMRNRIYNRSTLGHTQFNWIDSKFQFKRFDINSISRRHTRQEILRLGGEITGGSSSIQKFLRKYVFRGNEDRYLRFLFR